MDRFKFTTIAHSTHRLCSPISDEKFWRLAEVLELSEDSRVLDIACGKGEMLIRLAEGYGVSGVGVDFSSAFLDEARKQATLRGMAEQIEWVACDAMDYAGEAESFDVVSCLGARPFGSYQNTLMWMASWTKAGGLVVMGEGYWRRTPDPEYLKFLGATEADYLDHAGTEAVGAAIGLTSVYSMTSSIDEFDHYEGKYLATMERYLRANPDDPDEGAMRQRIRGWRDAYLRWGRETLGFGVYVFMK